MKMSEETKKSSTKRDLPAEIKQCVEASLSKKAEDIVVLDLHGISSFTDYFVIMHGNSNKQNKAIYEHVELEMKKDEMRPLSVEGKENAEWILMDYGHFIIHIFLPQSREYYSLEKLWGDGCLYSF